ncbi:MAG: alpha-L-rhamnosidase [Clostridia bacterium]|nr:alpha-L-rhamnosidase [Clostridia bacterium]
MIKDMKFSSEKNSLTVKYIMPVRIIKCENAENVEVLLKDLPAQAIRGGEPEVAVLHKGGHIIFDFGTELAGGITVTVRYLKENGEEERKSPNPSIRAVFGESVAEAMGARGEKNFVNDHSMRDVTREYGFMSTFRIGQTGFRFVRLEACDTGVEILSVKGAFEYRDIPYIGEFHCSDKRLEKIWNVGAYTVHLNMQDYLWDGIKRDRMVWIGDMHPEMLTIFSVFGKNECVTKSMDLVRDITPYTDWMNGHLSYSMWWVTLQHDWYFQTGDAAYLEENKDYLFGLLERTVLLIDENGDFKCDDCMFVDWSSKDTPYAKTGVAATAALALKNGAELARILKNDALAEKCEEAYGRIDRGKLKYDGNKQVAALLAVSGLESAEKINKDVLSNDPLRGISTFIGGYVLQARAEAGDTKGAIDVIRKYWGAMLDLGATTFWEDFDLDWTENATPIDEPVPEGKKDIHGDNGRFCYKQFRHSLCHGWASSPTWFLSKYVLGVSVKGPGCRKLLIRPCLGDLDYVRGKYPTPYGAVTIEHKKDKDGKIITAVDAPKGVEIISG